MKQAKKSTKLIDKLSRALELSNKAESLFACWRMEELGVKYTEEQRDLMIDADRHADAAKRKVKEVFKELIGKEIVHEIEMGLWKK